MSATATTHPTPAAPRRSPTRVLSAVGVVAAAVVIAWFVFTFVYYPNIGIIRSVIHPSAGSLGSVLHEMWQSDKVRKAIIDTGIVTLVSLVTVTVVGVLQTFLLEALDLRGRRILLIAYSVPLVFGSVAAVSGYLTVYGQNGFLTKTIRTLVPAIPADWFSGMAAVIFVHTFTMTGYHFLFLRPALRRVDFSMFEAARSLGMKPIPAMFRVVLPVLRPMLLAATLMVLIMSLGSFAAPNLLAGGDFNMVGPLIKNLTDLGRSDMASILGLALALLTVATMVWALRLERRSHLAQGSKTVRPFQRLKLRNPAARVAAHLVAYILAAINLAPLVVTALLSFSSSSAVRNGQLGKDLTLDNYRQIIDMPSVSQPLINSLELCVIAIPIAIIIGTAVAHISHRYSSRLTDAFQMSLFLPYFLPGVLIGLGLLVAFGDKSVLVGGNVLVGGFWILPIAYIVLLLPTTTRFIRAAYAGLDPAIDDAARSLGARPGRRFLLITLPMLAPVLVQVAALGFNHTFDEYPVSVMLYNVNNEPFGVAMGALSSNQDPTLAGVLTAYVVVNTLFALAVVTLADRMAERASRRGVGAQ